MNSKLIKINDTSTDLNTQNENDWKNHNLGILEESRLIPSLNQKKWESIIQKPWILMFFFWRANWVVKNSITLTRWSPCNWITSPNSSSLTMLPLHAKSFFKTRKILFKSYSSGKPWTVVNVLRPFLCWIRIWM